MKKNRAVLSLLLLLAVTAVTGCESRTDRSEGSVILSISDFGTVPLGVSLSTSSLQIDSLTVRSIPKNPLDTGPLQDTELRTYQVTYRRRDTGTRVPPPITLSIFETVPAGGSATLIGLPIFLSPQLGAQPLDDLLDFGLDRETGSAVVILDVTMTLFGRTIAGDDVATQPATFTVEVRQ
jgi:hypothetical protein